MQQFLEYSDEVKQALRNNQPVLALESTIITHGLPYPNNLETAQLVEQIAREEGAIPATIAIMNGKVKIGLSAAELQQLAEDKHAVKASPRDISFALSQRHNAGTTVAATMFCAAAAKIQVFATGGIGGVHRGNDYDISADLIELSRTPVAVVCAGVKAILDIPRTLEYLETVGVPVIGYRTDTFPTFYSHGNKYKLANKINEIADIAQLIDTHWKLGLSSGILVSNPIPAIDAIPEEIIEPVILAALQLVERNQITGKAVTPFLLKEVVKATEGKSMSSNIALIKNNARVGAQLACSVASFR